MSRLVVIGITSLAARIFLRFNELRIQAFPLMAVSAFELRQVAQVDRVLEWRVPLVAISAFQSRHLAQVQRMLERAVF